MVGVNPTRRTDAEPAQESLFRQRPKQPEQASELYSRVLNDINRRYVIGYYPTNRTRDGKRRNVSIEVRGHPEYIVIETL